jgi:DUF4097 and DUF4098 domain-containing protein YvlB
MATPRARGIQEEVMIAQMAKSSNRASIRRALAVATVWLSLAGVAVAGPGHRLEREEKNSVSATGKKSLVVKNARGRTVVVGRTDAKTVSVVALKSAVGNDKDAAAEMLDKITVQVTERGDEVVIETRDDGKWDNDWSLWSVVKGGRRSAWVDYTIEVPHSFRVSASTTSGEVRVSNLQGAAEVTATSGDVSMRAVGGGSSARMTSGDLEVIEVAGDLSVSATSGSVVVDNIKGKLEIEGTSGDFRASRVDKDADIQLASGDFILEGCSGNVSFRAASGDAVMREIDGSVDAASSSGDIEVLIIPVAERSFSLSTSSGDVIVYFVPVKGFGFQLDVRTSSGSIEGDLPIKVTRADRRRLQGVVGSGAARVDIETASGDVTITERAEAADSR